MSDEKFDLLAVTDPNRCGYELTVIWPDGQRTRYEGVSLNAETCRSETARAGRRNRRPFGGRPCVCLTATSP
jgi:hypothetical protein